MLLIAAPHARLERAGPRRPRRCSSSRRRTPGCASRPRRRDRTRSAAGFRRRAAARRKSPARVGARRSLEALFHWRRALESSWELDSNTTAPASGDESVSESNAKVSRAKLFRWKSTHHGHYGPKPVTWESRVDESCSPPSRPSFFPRPLAGGVAQMIGHLPIRDASMTVRRVEAEPRNNNTYKPEMSDRGLWALGAHDGVLADFERGVAERTKRQPKE
ncbi:hypothetical protein AK812_SmicGene13722 [Symbiodinium microadriaticum]|uniref:Uncharacterized protein n=1 Tax=Symbiodinium microadriaticum TaxID=2951 RepID=A0A1Q9E7H6_SYMMI|nr:hypothetical protein AK812_SmicGene13722 [Symbiodinium microadriaticum]